MADGKNDDTANGWFIGKPINEVWTYKYDRLWQNTTDDQKLLAVYKANGITMFPGMAKLVDQPFIEVPKGTEGAVTKTIDVNGQKQEITYMNNGFGKFDNDDNHFLGSFTPEMGRWFYYYIHLQELAAECICLWPLRQYVLRINANLRTSR